MHGARKMSLSAITFNFSSLGRDNISLAKSLIFGLMLDISLHFADFGPCLRGYYRISGNVALIQYMSLQLCIVSTGSSNISSIIRKKTTKKKEKNQKA